MRATLYNLAQRPLSYLRNVNFDAYWRDSHREISDFFLVSNELRSARLAARVCSLLKHAVAGSPQRIAFLEESSSDYMQLIRTFEADRVELQRRLATADPAEAARIEQGLRVNQRGLELLQNALARIKAELAQERAKPDT